LRRDPQLQQSPSPHYLNLARNTTKLASQHAMRIVSSSDRLAREADEHIALPQSRTLRRGAAAEITAMATIGAADYFGLP
jgi:hypothetical protein